MASVRLSKHLKSTILRKVRESLVTPPDYTGLGDRIVEAIFNTNIKEELIAKGVPEAYIPDPANDIDATLSMDNTEINFDKLTLSIPRILPKPYTRGWLGSKITLNPKNFPHAEPFLLELKAEVDTAKQSARGVSNIVNATEKLLDDCKSTAQLLAVAPQLAIFLPPLVRGRIEQQTKRKSKITPVPLPEALTPEILQTLQVKALSKALKGN